MRLSIAAGLIFMTRASAAAEAPNFDATAYCKGNSYVELKELDRCIEMENKSRALFRRLMGSIPPRDFADCVASVSHDGTGSYLRLNTCIELNPLFGKPLTARATGASNAMAAVPPAHGNPSDDKISSAPADDGDPALKPSPSPAAPSVTLETTGSIRPAAEPKRTEELPLPAVSSPADRRQPGEDKTRASPSGSSAPASSGSTSPAAKSDATGSLRAEPARAPKFRFDRDLRLGSVDPDVRQLQIFLNANGFRVADSGPGSPGHEAEKFGAATKAALAEFQKAHAQELLTPSGLSQPTGFLGKATRNLINKM